MTVWHHDLPQRSLIVPALPPYSSGKIVLLTLSWRESIPFVWTCIWNWSTKHKLCSIFNVQVFKVCYLTMLSVSKLRNPYPVTLCLLQIPQELNLDWNHAYAVGNPPLTAWARLLELKYNIAEVYKVAENDFRNYRRNINWMILMGWKSSFRSSQQNRNSAAWNYEDARRGVLLLLLTGGSLL